MVADAEDGSTFGSMPSGGAALGSAVLILLAFALFVTEHLVHYPVALMSVLGVALLVTRSEHAREPDTRTLVLLFCCLWVPMLVASVDALNPARAWKTTLLYLHLLPAACFVLLACRDAAVLRLVTLGVTGLVLFAGFDAFVQLIWRVDLFGYPFEGGVLKGVFHPKQRLGLFLAVFAPLCVEVVIGWCRRYPRIWLLLVPLVIVILMSLKRSAWLMLVVGLAGYLALVLHGGRTRWRDLPLVPLALAGVLAGVTIAASPTLQQRLDDSSGVFSLDADTFDEATGYRLSLWRTGGAMLRAHWLNGIGPRGYRYAYTEYAPPDDFWVERGGTGQTHPHLLGLEVAVETGFVGFAGWFVFYALLLRVMWRAAAHAGRPMWLLCAAIASFPLNAHLAFYGSYWATLLWLLVPIGIAAARPAPARG